MKYLLFLPLILSTWALDVATRPTRQTWVADGFVQAIREHQGTIYVGGSFRRAGPWSGAAALINPATGDEVPGFPKVNGLVSSAVPDGAGGLLIIGNFSDIGGVPITNIARLKADATLDVNWTSNATNSIRGLTVHGDTIFFWMPSYTEFNFTYTRIGAMRLSDGAQLPLSITIRGTINALAASETLLYVGGDFTFNNAAPYSLAAFNHAGQLQSWDGRLNNEVGALVLANNILYVGGAFTTVNNQPRAGLAALNASTAQLLPWNPLTPPYSVNAMHLSGETLFLVGTFAVAGNASVTNLAAFNATTGDLIPLHAQTVSFYPNALAATSDYILTGGNNAALGYNMDLHKILTLHHRQTGANVPISLAPNFAVLTAAPLGSNIFIGGAFSMLRGEERNSAAAFDAATGELTPWNPRAQATIFSIAVAGNKVFLGGEFTNIAGIPRRNLAAVDRTSGALDMNWQADANFGVIDMATHQNTLYVGGIFRTIAGQSRTNLAAIDAQTGALLPFNALLNNAMVRAVTISGDTLYIGGLFRSVLGATRNRLAAIDLNTGSLTPWDPQITTTSSLVEDIEVAGSTIYFSGRFAAVAGQPRTNAAAVTLAGELLPWAPNADRPVYDLAIAGDKVFLTGEFLKVGNQTRTGIAVCNNTDGQVLPWAPEMDFFGYCATATANQVYVGGAFYTLFAETRFGFGSFALTAAAPPFLAPAIRFQQNGLLQLEFQSTPGLHVIPQYSEDLTNWFDLAPIFIQSGQNSIQDSIRPRSFYRLKQ